MVRLTPAKSAVVPPAHRTTVAPRRTLEPSEAIARGHSSSLRPIRIVIADDCPVFRYGLSELLRTQTDFSVVGETDNGDEAMRLVGDLQPDVVLLDASMVRSSGIDMLRRSRTQTDARIIVLTAAIAPSLVAHVINLGARGIVLKNSPTPLLFKSIRSVFDGQLWFCRSEMASLVGALAAQTGDRAGSTLRLTRREQEVLELVASGESNRECARKLQVSEDTIKHHLTNIFDKTGVSTRTELALYAIEHQLLVVNSR